MALSVGLTGGLAAGKSSVARKLAEAGCEVIDADQIVADLYAPGAAGSRFVEEALGPEYLDDAGAVDREAVATRVFRDAEARRRLEEGIHPLVRREFERRAAASDGIVVLEAALLVETGWGQELDLLVTVEAPEEIRLDRAAARDGSRDEAARRIAAQGSEEARRAAADYVVENDGSLADLDLQVDRLLVVLRRRALAADPVS